MAESITIEERDDEYVVIDFVSSDVKAVPSTASRSKQNSCKSPNPPHSSIDADTGSIDSGFDDFVLIDEFGMVDEVSSYSRSLD